MSNLTFPAVGKPYRGFVDKLRNWLRETATFLDKSPAAIDDVSATIGAVFADQAAAVVVDTQALVVPVTGTYVTTATLTVVDGEVTAITLS